MPENAVPKVTRRAPGLAIVLLPLVCAAGVVTTYALTSHDRSRPVSPVQPSNVEVVQANGNIVMCDVTDDGLVCSDGRFYADAAEALVAVHPVQARTLSLDPTHAPTIAEDRCEVGSVGLCRRVE